MPGKMLNGSAWGEGWVHWVVIAPHSTGNSCLVLEAGQKNCCGLGLDFCFACIFAFPALRVPECLLPLDLPEDPLSPATFLLPAKLSVK